MGAAAEIFGDCTEGSTAAATNCADGQTTGVAGTVPHGCLSGGIASDSYGGCSSGSQVLSPQACYGGDYVDL